MGSREPSTEQQHGVIEGAASPVEAVRVWLLGDFRVSVGISRGIGKDEWRLKKAANLLKLLSLAPGHRLHRDRAMDLLWPDLDPRAASNNLHHALYVARRTLEPSSPGAASSYLLLRDERLALCPDGSLWVDVDAFEAAAMTARHALEVAAYRAALDLYQGELLPQDRYEPWAEQRRAELRELYLSLLVELAALYEERGEHGPAIEVLSRVVAEESTHEEAHVGLMRLYALSGRRRDALGQYEQLREALYREFGTEPDAASMLLQQEIWKGINSPSPSPRTLTSEEQPSAIAVIPHNLPLMRTSFVGRERETREVGRLLAMTGLLTLTGAGGSGKTRLALEVARNLVGAYPDGVWLVELAALSEAALLPQAVAGTLGVPEIPGRLLEETIADYLRKKNLLLVVDNCEHLVGPVALLAEALLGSCPRLRILATSREPLGARGEVVWRVPPLSLPGAEGASSIEEVAATEAARLFVDRASSRLPGFELAESNAGAVGSICRKLDGIPLAIELAAARMGALAVEQIAQRLDDSLMLLTGGRTAEPRQQTLRATLDWSHELLSDSERTMFRRLSVFAGGWTLETSEEVCQGENIEPEEVVDLLSRLVDKSLVVAEYGDAMRYRMLEPVRQYGHERLEESGEAQRIRKRHAEYFLELATAPGTENAESFDVREGRSVAWLAQMEGEHGNLVAALSWAFDEDAEPGGQRAAMGLQLAAMLFPFWHVHPIEGWRYLERAASAKSTPTTILWKTRALLAASFLAGHQGDFGAAKALVEEGLALARETADGQGIASCLTHIGLVAVLGSREDIDLPAVLEELTGLKPRLENRTTLGYLLVLEGLVALGGGDLDRAESLHEEALGLFRELRDAVGIHSCLIDLGGIALVRGDHERATPFLHEALRLDSETENYSGIQLSLLGLASVAVHREQRVRAARLGGVVEGMKESLGLYPTAVALSATNYEVLLAQTRSRLEKEIFTAAWAEGKAMTLEQAVEYAFADDVEHEPPAPEARPPDADPMGSLTRRELEVALLVGQGLTNRRIASELSISQSTVQNHVHKILKKLGLSSRAGIAAWAARH